MVWEEVTCDLGVTYYPKAISWKEGTDCCSWNGVMCDRVTGHVVGLNISSLYSCSCLRGSIHSNSSLFLLSHLQMLDLSFNDFMQSRISPMFGRFTNLTHLNLYGSKFSGTIPPEISHLSKLVVLDLSANYVRFETIDFKVLAENLTKLRDLGLNQVDMSSVVPDTLMNFSSLTSLSLVDSGLHGKLPENIFHLPNLQSLNLGGNDNLYGYLPNFNSSSLLNELILGSTSFSGQIPNSIQNLKSLTSLFLTNCKFSGSIPSSLGNLTQLTYLYLWYNHFNGEVPSSLSNLEQLIFFTLSKNNFEGQFPNIFAKLTKLVELHLDCNNFNGQFPSFRSNLTELAVVDLSNNQLTGPIPSPSKLFFSIANNKMTGILSPSICNLTSLQFLDLSNNSLHGSIPLCLANSNIDLSLLNLQRNGFHGFIPPTYANGSRLRSLDVGHNKLEGLLPRSLANFTKLQVLNLENNTVADTFPHWLATLPDLHVLVLRSNRFHGSIGQLHSGLAFTQLRIIDISHNNFTGELPSKYFEGWYSMAMVEGKTSKAYYMGERYYYYFDSLTITNKGIVMVMVRILTLFKAIDFSNNRLEGEIPESIGMLKSLHVLNFSNNGLTGHIPSSLSNLTELESLDLSRNELSGVIPQQLTILTFLEVFDVSHNHLVGPIPRGAQFETFSNTSYKDNSGLCGFPLSNQCGKLDGAHSPPSTTQQSHNYKSKMDGFDWKVVLMGYGCGLVIGVVGGYFILTRKEELFNKVFNVGHHRRRKRMNRARG